MAEALCRTHDRDPPAVPPRPCDRTRRGASPSSAAPLPSPLPRGANSPFAGEGRARTTAGGATRARPRCRRASSWWPSPSLHPTSRLASLPLRGTPPAPLREKRWARCVRRQPGQLTGARSSHGLRTDPRALAGPSEASPAGRPRWTSWTASLVGLASRRGVGRSNSGQGHAELVTILGRAAIFLGAVALEQARVADFRHRCYTASGRHGLSTGGGTFPRAAAARGPAATTSREGTRQFGEYRPGARRASGWEVMSRRT